jgi:hypothetical protein
MATKKDGPGQSSTGKSNAQTRGVETKNPAPAPVDTSEESVAGEEDPGASNEELEEPAFNRPPPKRPGSGG